MCIFAAEISIFDRGDWAERGCKKLNRSCARHKFRVLVMKTFTKLGVLVLLYFYSIAVGAYDFEVDGIYYNVTSITELTVETTNNASNPNTYGEGDNSYYRSNGEITIPSTVLYNGSTFRVTAVGDGTFKKCTSLRYIHIPNTITVVGGSAFSECANLQEFVFPNSVTSIGYGCFYNCQKLSKLIFPEGLKTIPDHCCYYCSSLTEITIPSSVETIESFAFAHGIKYVVCKSNNAPSISADYNKTFKYSTPKYIYIPKGSIESYREKKWPGEYVEYENGTLTIYPTFESNSFTYETTKLSGGLEVAIINFSDKETIDLQIPTNVIYEGINYTPTAISSGVFANCTQAETLTIPNNITSLGDNSFSGCSSLKTIISQIKQPMAVQAFSNYQYMFTTLRVPTGTIELYRQTDGWKDFVNIYEDGDIPDNPTVNKCATPSIAFENGKLYFSTATPMAEVVSTITVDDAKTVTANEIALSATYNITAYAKRSNYQNSDIVTATLVWDVATLNVDKPASVSTVPQSVPLFISQSNGIVSVNGLQNDSIVTAYDTSGKILDYSKKIGNNAILNLSAFRGMVVIIKVNERSIKTVVK